MKIAYLFTTFPVLTETTFQREIRVLKTKDIDLEIYSLWGGDLEFEKLTIRQFPKWKLLLLCWWIPYWIAKKPHAFWAIGKEIRKLPIPSLGNLSETIIGFSFALINAGAFKASAPNLIHAAWSTMPASAGLLLKKLTEIPFSIEGHAYDVFKNGGDWLLKTKIREAEFTRTSSESTRRRLLEISGEEDDILLVRRGLDRFPPMSPIRTARTTLRILSVGRLVEKMGYFDQLEIYACTLAKGIEIEVRIVGEGFLRSQLESRIRERGLEERVTLMGSKPFEFVLEQLAWADLFFFSGIIAQDGDRAGFPNAVGEAMAAGVSVLATSVAGIPEAIEDGRSGILVDVHSSSSWLEPMQRLQRDDRFYTDLRERARDWVEKNFDAWANMEGMYRAFRNYST